MWTEYYLLKGYPKTQHIFFIPCLVQKSQYYKMVNLKRVSFPSAGVKSFLLLQQTAVQSSTLFLSRTVDRILQTCSVVKDSAATAAATAGNCSSILLEEQEWSTCQQSSGGSVKTCPSALGPQSGFYWPTLALLAGSSQTEPDSTNGSTKSCLYWRAQFFGLVLAIRSMPHPFGVKYSICQANLHFLTLRRTAGDPFLAQSGSGRWGWWRGWTT